jgi:hypothetical protein
VFDVKIHAALDRNEVWVRTVILRSDAETAAFVRGQRPEQSPEHATSAA